MTTKLAEKTCTPCRGGVAPLTAQQAEELRAQAPEWALLDDAHRDLGATPEEIKAIATVLGPRGRDGALKEGQQIRVLLSSVRGSQRLQPMRVMLVGSDRAEGSNPSRFPDHPDHDRLLPISARDQRCDGANSSRGSAARADAGNRLRGEQRRCLLPEPVSAAAGEDARLLTCPPRAAVYEI
jgi:hypothetical protein